MVLNKVYIYIYIEADNQTRGHLLHIISFLRDAVWFCHTFARCDVSITYIINLDTPPPPSLCVCSVCCLFSLVRGSATTPTELPQIHLWKAWLRKIACFARRTTSICIRINVELKIRALHFYPCAASTTDNNNNNIYISTSVWSDDDDDDDAWKLSDSIRAFHSAQKQQTIYNITHKTNEYISFAFKLVVK